MRLRTLWIGGLAAALLGPAFGQPPGGGPTDSRGFGGKGGFTTDRGERFNQYTGGKESWSRSDIRDPDQLRSFDRLAEQLGVTNGAISRQQYVDHYQKTSERFGGMRSPGGSTTMTAPGGMPSLSAFPGAGSTMPSPSTPLPSSGRSRSFGSADGMANMADSSFRRADANGDGVLSNNELSDILRNERERFDNNNDGVIDSTEYRSFMEARAQQFQSERANNPLASPTMGGSPSRSFGTRPGEGSSSFDPTALSMTRSGNGSSPMSPSRSFDPSSLLSMNRGDRSGPSGSNGSQRQPEQPSRAVVYRPGSLPAGLPSWFQQRDTDGDGQVGLYEWRNGGASISDFQKLDANGDGFVTVEEVLRDQKGFNSSAVASNSRDTSPSRGGGFSSSPRPGSAEPPSFDRDQMLEMMSRGRELREAMMRGGATSMPSAMGTRTSEGTNGNGSASPYSERNWSKSKNGNGKSSESSESRDQGDSNRRGKGRGGN